MPHTPLLRSNLCKKIYSWPLDSPCKNTTIITVLISANSPRKYNYIRADARAATFIFELNNLPKFHSAAPHASKAPTNKRRTRVCTLRRATTASRPSKVEPLRYMKPTNTLLIRCRCRCNTTAESVTATAESVTAGPLYITMLHPRSVICIVLQPQSTVRCRCDATATIRQV